MADDQVILYTTDPCGFCRQAKALLQALAAGGLSGVLLLLFAGQTVIFLLRLVAADRRAAGRRRPLGSATKTVGELEDDAPDTGTATPDGADDFRRMVRCNLSAWAEQTCGLRYMLAMPDDVDAVAVSPDGKTFAAGCVCNEIQCWDAAP